MSTYLIDFENVKSAGLSGIDRIAASDSVHLFWSARENKISIEMMELIRKSASEIEMHKASIGERDALDHQLCSFLGYLAGQAKDDSFVIISNDKAYDHLIEFWKELRSDIKIVRVPEIAKVSVPAAKASQSAQKNAEVTAAKNVSEEKAFEAETPDKPSTETAEQQSPENNRRRRERKSENGGRRGRGRYDRRRNTEEAALEGTAEAPAAYTEEVTVVERKDQQDFAVQTVMEEPLVVMEAAKEEKPEADMQAEESAASESIISPEEALEAAVEETEEAAAEGQEETKADAKEEVLAEKSAPVKSFWGTPDEAEEEASIKPVSVSAVVSRIVTSVVQESGYTANGIMDGYKVQEETDSVNEAATEAKAAAEEEKALAEEEAEGIEKAEEAAKEAAAAEEIAEVAVQETASLEGAALEAVEAMAEQTASEESPVNDETEAASETEEVPAEEITVEEAPTVDAPAEVEAVAEEPASESPVMETEDSAATVKAEEEAAETQAAPVVEEVTEKPARKPARSRSRKPAKKAEEAKPQEEAAEEKAAKPAKKTRTAKNSKKTKAEADQPVDAEKAEGEEKPAKTEKKPAKAKAKSPKAETPSKPAKEEKTEAEGEAVKAEVKEKPAKAANAPKSQEAVKKGPASEADVIAKYPEAEGQEWLPSLVEAINESEDRRHMYGMIVKVLGQENGRVVYHAIKALK